MDVKKNTLVCSIIGSDIHNVIIYIIEPLKKIVQ